MLVPRFLFRVFWSLHLTIEFQIFTSLSYAETNMHSEKLIKFDIYGINQHFRDIKYWNWEWPFLKFKMKADYTKTGIIITYHPVAIPPFSRDWYGQTAILVNLWDTNLQRSPIIPSPFTHFCTQKRCYTYIVPTDCLSWNQARRICQRERSDLLAINSYEEYDIVLKIVSGLTGYNSHYKFALLIFLGLIGTEVSYTNFACNTT